jgi:hydroxymethylpyrimidine/phosphomethylpyrimidine kinase
MELIPRALTIAGSDSGGGAGIQADLKTFTAFKVFGMSAITSITAQNTLGVFEVFDLPPETVQRQIDVICEDIGVSAAKTGMLSNENIISAVAESIVKNKIEKLVVDPVMRAKSGDPLLKPTAEKALIEKILPLALLITPNIPEAEALSGKRIKSIKDMREVAKCLMDYGPKNVLVKGGHLDEKFAIDILYNGSEFYEFGADKIETKNTHGTGCTYSSAITSMLAWGKDLITSVDVAKRYVTEAIRQSFGIGKGHGPLNHFVSVEGMP